jgi:hypothetical protein
MISVTSILVIVGITLLAFFVASFSYGEAHLKNIKENWVQYRCNPLYMPLADLVGSDILSNFMGCTMSAFQTYAGYALDPIYSMFDVVGGTITDIQGTLDDFRDMISGTKNAFLSIISDIYGKLLNTFATLTHLIARIRTLTNRILATFVIVFHMVTTGVQTGESVANGPIGQAAEFFCFSPYTQIKTAKGQYVQIQCLKPGEILENGALVESVLAFHGEDTPMCRLGTVVVSANHKVLFKGKWIRVENHPQAAALDVRYTTIWCLNTSTNTIPIEKFLFKDYEETHDVATLQKFESIVELTYNRSALLENSHHRHHPLDYKLSGAVPWAFVRMEDRSIKYLHSIQIGDRVAKGGRVLGVVYHHRLNDPVTTSAGILISKGTWIFDQDGMNLYTADAIGNKTFVDPGLNYQAMNLLTENGYVTLSNGIEDCVILDDQETTEDWVHSWRDEMVQKETLL